MFNELPNIPRVMADWEGISMATSFKVCTYLISSMTGRRMAKPWSKNEKFLQIIIIIYY